MSEAPVALSELPLSAEVAGGKLSGQMTGLGDFRLWIDQTYYLSSTDSSMADDVGRLGRLLISQRLTAQLEDDRRSGVSSSDFPAGSRHRRELDDYNDAVAAIHDESSSPDGSVRMSAVAMTNLVVQVRTGTVPHVPLTGFAAACETAAAGLIADHMRQVWQLRVSMFSHADH